MSTATMSTADTNAWRVTKHVLKQRQEDRGAAARVRTGLVPETEHRAYAEILPLVSENTSRTETTALLRASALIALHPSLTQDDSDKKLNLGSTFRRFSIGLGQKRNPDTAFNVDPKTPDSIASRLSQLPEQDLDNAALTLHRVLTLADGLEIPIDFVALTKLLMRWGNGMSAGSLQVRHQLLRDYYGYNN